MIEKFLEKHGYLKAQRIGEITAQKNSGTNSLLGDSDLANYSKYLQAYADEVWIYACVYTIATAVAGLTFRLYKPVKGKDGKTGKEEVLSGPAYQFMQIPCKQDKSMTWYALMEFTMSSLELTGNAYWLQNGDKTPDSVIPLIASRVQIIPNPDPKAETGFVKEYKYKPAGGTFDSKDVEPFSLAEITHFKYMNPNNYIYGLPSLSAARKATDAYHYMTDTNLNIFRKASLVDLFLKTDKVINDKVYDRLLSSFRAKHTGASEAHSVGILEQGLDIVEVRQNLRDLEYDLGRRFTREEICSVFNVPPLLVGILDKATYSNFKESIKVFFQLCIIPKLKRINPNLTALVKQYDPSYFIEADLSEIEALREDEEVKARIAKAYFDMGIPMQQINKKLNLGLEEFEGWDVGYLPFGLTPVGSAGSEPDEPEEPKAYMSPYEKSMGKEWKAEKWHRYTRLTSKIENSYKKIIAGYFADQAKEVIGKLESKKEFPKADIEKASIEVQSILFNEKNEAIKFAKTTRKVHSLALEETAKQELIMLGLTIDFSMSSTEVVKWLDKYGLKRATDVMSTAREGIRDQLVEGLKNNETIDELKKRLVDFYDGYKEAGYKAERMARTEVIAASNQGNLEAYRQSDVVDRKGWLSEPDARDTHLKASQDYDEKHAIPIDENFEVGGDTMPAPGQGKEASENCNCRCSLFGVLKKGIAE